MANEVNQSSKTKSKGRNCCKKALKAIAWTLFGVLILIVLLLSATVWILTPERLTPIMEDVASDNLKARVEIGRAELTLWKSFPRLRVEVDDLHIISKSLESLDKTQKALLPADADSVLSVGHFEGGINVLKAITGKISLNDVIIDRPRINLLQVNDSVSNFDIFPTSEPDTVKSSPSIPDIYINRFAITNALPITYKSMADTLDIALYLHTIQLDDEPSPLYELTVDTHIETPMLSLIDYDRIQFNLDGGLAWSASEPYRLRLEDLMVKLAEIDAVVSTDIDFGEGLRIESFMLKLRSLDIAPLLTHLPPDAARMVKSLDTNMTVDTEARLLKPYTLRDSLTLPFMKIDVTVPDCHIYYDKLHFNSFLTDISVNIDGDKPDLSTIDISRLKIDGQALDVDLRATLSNLLSNPRAKGHFRGEIDFSKLPADMISKLGASIKGSFSADTDFNLAVSDLTQNSFHRIYAKGEVGLRNFSFLTNDSITGAYVRHSTLTFGSNERLSQEGHIVDSMLVLRFEADTASFRADGLNGQLRKLHAVLGASNTHSSLDTTIITPFGGSFTVDRLTYNSLADSIRIRLNKASGAGMLRRFEGDKKLPQLGLKLDIGSMGMMQPDLKVIVSQANANLQANLKPRRNRASRTNDSADKIQHSERRRPNTQRYYTQAQLDSIGAETIDFNIDNSLKSLLFRWNIHGQLKAKRGGLRMSAINLPNRFSDLDIALSTDSVALNSLHYKLGHSDFGFNGVIANLKGALASRRPTPLRIDLNVVSDTINVNEVVRALSRPATDKVDSVEDSAKEWADDTLDEFEKPGEPTDSVMDPLLVPVNIDAGFTLNAHNVIYSDLLLKNLTGELLVYQGTVNLHNLSANTEMGSLDLSALYSAPTPDNMNFGLGMSLKDFHIERVTRLIPAFDSIMPMMKSLSGVINAQIAVTSDLTPDMYFDIPTMKAAMKFEGDSLVVFDSETFRKISRWLLFKNKQKNMIDHLNVQLTVENGILNLYPFYLDIDRYKLGLMGHNNLNLDLNYHISVLKSPIPFKFGINIKGRPDKLKIRLGGAKFKEKMVAERDSIASNTRINLLTEMNNVFHRGLKAARLGPLEIKGRADTTYMNSPEDIITAADSALMIKEGLIEAPDTVPTPLQNLEPKATKKSKRKK